MPENSYKDRWLRRFSRRIQALVRDGPIQFEEDGKTIFEFNVGETLTVDGARVNIELIKLGLKTKGNLVGMGGCYYDPNFFWGETVDRVIKSWEWLIGKLNLGSKPFQIAIETETIIEFLVKGREEGLLLYLLSLAIDLFDLDSLGVNVYPKLSELGLQARGHLRKFEKLKGKAESFFVIGSLRSYMADLSAECRLAKLSRKYGCEVKLGKHPDLTINGKTVEVKRSKSIPLANLSAPINRGLEQMADIIAIQTADLEKRNIKGFKTLWLGTDKLKNVLQTSLTLKSRKKCVLLFCGTNRGYFGRIILIKGQ